MMNLATIQSAESKLMLQTYARLPILFTGGHGCYMTDAEGNDYLDLLSGIGVSALGYGHPAVEQALAAQATKLLHTSNLFYNEHAASLAMRLTEISGLDRVFFCNSGTEAWEAALKIARANAERVRLEGGKLGTRFLALEHSFHGRTLGSVATTHKLAYRQPFAPVLPGVDFVAFNEIESLRTAFSDEVCAVLIEVVQGEGGVHPVSREFFAAARELCDSTGALLIADEIQCGFGRTGTWFGYQQFGILPDVTTLAKPAAGGLPFGAMLCTELAASSITPGMHGTTFGGGPLVCAVANAVIDEIKQSRLLDHVAEVGAYFLQQLRALAARQSCIKEVRGLGLMIGAELDSTELATRVVAEMLEEQHIILNRTSDNVLRFLPPYILTREQVDSTITALEQVLAANTAALTSSTGAHAHG